jgi:hypothetical protein
MGGAMRRPLGLDIEDVDTAGESRSKWEVMMGEGEMLGILVNAVQGRGAKRWELQASCGS